MPWKALITGYKGDGSVGCWLSDIVSRFAGGALHVVWIKWQRDVFSDVVAGVWAWGKKCAVDARVSDEASYVRWGCVMCCAVVDDLCRCGVVCSPCVPCLIVWCAEFDVGCCVHAVCSDVVVANRVFIDQVRLCLGCSSCSMWWSLSFCMRRRLRRRR